MKTVQDYIDKYGFCNWQAQELLQRLVVAEQALRDVVAFTAERKSWLDYLPPELQAIENQCNQALNVLENEP